MSNANPRTVGIVGLGYVGLPLAGAFEAAGHHVIGFDIDPSKPEKLDQANSYLPHLGQHLFDRLASSSRFLATGDEADLAKCDAILVCVPTPVDDERQPNLDYVQDTFQMIRRVHSPGCLVVLESTTWPGTTREICLPLLSAGGRTLGEDFFLAFAPEREDPGRDTTLQSVPRLVGGLDKASQEQAVALYSQVCGQVVPVSSAEVAEAAKLLENTYRAVNIALVNEYKLILDRMGIDIHEVVDAASTKPYGFSRFDPGPGLGGHCIPVDPWYFAWAATEWGTPVGLSSWPVRSTPRCQDMWSTLWPQSWRRTQGILTVQQFWFWGWPTRRMSEMFGKLRPRQSLKTCGDVVPTCSTTIRWFQNSPRCDAMTWV